MGIISSSIARKVAMALSGLFLVLFLGQHFTINLTSTFSPETFNEFSHFMGTNFLVQAILQPVLIFGVIFHFVMGFILEIRNRSARQISYVSYKGSANSSWVSRNMIYSGIVILAFLGLHFYDFWFPEIAYKYIEGNPADATRYYGELVEKFHSPVRTGLYVLSFIFLALHLYHGFASSFQSVGFNNKYATALKKFAKVYAIVIPAGFIFIALFHHFNH
ncbi:succinate dehydrogenase / fumarate reductase cytochrome b subunit [Leeuwenhoekiella aestuarii]|uniref:Succinate dehydrogenase / fumarate reductase cytochrome b subunit n=1 Tax=Leeuwenhoekiella aestuarii TaxID=2249426 RepID=A0A4Q0P0P3_9FLAO|nr:succinate dehydrogenase cytochrome b subunit [Leeuwenhoekiella aestuarii]RXG18156.1 succinate dehydrogenase / fumarate reductase cytochrome b subunit [Leeuwenhoekiella aestuarii]RXG19461.1 succinate dehydrogenase / fumarate reductase cytochrome b subunit [Leeuwenhoekiella aestuarii]